MTVNLPNRCRDDGEEPEFMRDVPKICYQNHFELDDSTFMFGGVYASASMNFTHLGIPAEVDVSKIKVYFPYQLPPFVDTKILTNPYMIPHPHFLQYNATRGSVTYLDTSEMEDFPDDFPVWHPQESRHSISSSMVDLNSKTSQLNTLKR